MDDEPQGVTEYVTDNGQLNNELNRVIFSNVISTEPRQNFAPVTH